MNIMLHTSRNAKNGGAAYWYSTDYDFIGRPTNATDSVSLMREWLYNNRSELASATIGTNHYGYSYDTIGNRLWSAANLATNTYVANALNQYTSVGRGVLDPPQTSALIYDADGNMTRDDRFLYSYDAENRLRSIISSVVTNGALRVQNTYDHRNRRIRKTVQRLSVSVAQPPAPPVEIREWQTLETHTFVWDGNNIVLEKVDFADGTTRTFEYFWGLDKSGTEQGAGGVGGLLAVSVDGVFYIPCYDHNGNIILYISEIGAPVAQYTYDPYGNIIESSGSLAGVFSFGFSTKYHDHETGMVGYKRRFYRPDLGRWLNRDPIEEKGGENLYAFCNNSTPCIFDVLGTSSCCRNGVKVPCDKYYRWEGQITTSSLTWGLGVTFLIIDLKSNFVCMTCSRARIHIKAVLLTASYGAPFSLTGSRIELGNVSPDAFVGSVSLIGGGAGAMGVVEASSLRIGNVWVNNIGLVGGAELGVGGAHGWFVDFEMVHE